MLLHLGSFISLRPSTAQTNDVLNGLSESPEGDRGYHVYIPYSNVAALISTSYVVVLFVNFLCSVINAF